MADKFEDYCKKLTLGSNSFKEIIHKKQIFVDKTDIVNKLCQRGKYKLLQRPNGFGKTILVDMLEELFLHGVKPYGDHDSYFKGLKIEKLWKDRNTYQVLRFDCFHRQLGDLVDVCSIYTDFALTLSKFAQTYGYEYHDSFSPLDNLDRILEESQENSIVFLIDDFDTPILNVCHSLSCYLETTGHPLDIVTDFLRFILLRIQDFADKFRFVFLTTSNRYYDPTAYFAQSNVKDISFNQELSNIVGFTKEEIKDIVLASSAMPIIYPTKQIKENDYVDGGFLDNTPVRPLVELGLKEIVVVHLFDWTEDEKSKWELSIEGLDTDDIIFHHISPSEPFNFIDAFVVNKVLTMGRIQLGYEDAKECLQIKD